MTKFIFLSLIVFSVSSFAAVVVPVTAEDTELKSSAQSVSGGKDYKWKTHIDCDLKTTGTDALYPHQAPVTYYICPDKTITHIQPSSTGLNGWEGYCGQTAVSNVVSMLCNRHMSPKSNDIYGTDFTPGQHSSTMKKSLQKIFTEFIPTNTCPQKVTWKVRSQWSSASFLQTVKGDLFGSSHKIKRFRSPNTWVMVTPTPVLINSGGLNYHWVTVVDIIRNQQDAHGCDVVINTWGNQKTLTCENLMSYANHSGISERVSLGFD